MLPVKRRLKLFCRINVSITTDVIDVPETCIDIYEVVLLQNNQRMNEYYTLMGPKMRSLSYTASAEETFLQDFLTILENLEDNVSSLLVVMCGSWTKYWRGCRQNLLTIFKGLY